MKKENIVSILSKKELIIFIIIVIFVGLWAVSQNSTDLTPVEETQKKISQELGQKTDSIIEKLDNQNTALYLLNQNVKNLDNNKADKTTVQNIQYEVNNLNSNYEKISSDISEIKNTIKTIEPSYVQNIDLKDFRTYINIFNFRLILNFFIAVSLSLLAVEGIKIFGDFFSYANKTKNWSIQNYIHYRKTNNLHKLVEKVKIHHHYTKKE
jgi:hypothetical protein